MEVDGGVSHTQVQRNVVIQHINQPVAIHHASHPGMQASGTSFLPAMSVAWKTLY